ncbi:hypothetical protein, partial [Brevibacillus formosus]|uniref:hypothetical protein n=1 Tax=Brevibacillus formosus TaxID=54913 RepID=UPI003F1A9084
LYHRVGLPAVRTWASSPLPLLLFGPGTEPDHRAKPIGDDSQNLPEVEKTAQNVFVQMHTTSNGVTWLRPSRTATKTIQDASDWVVAL